MTIQSYAETLKKEKVNLQFWIVLIYSVLLIQPTYSENYWTKSAAAYSTKQSGTAGFSHNLYNVTIPENSLGKTYAKTNLHEDVAGIKFGPNYDIKYRIIGGDKEKLFKADERLVGNFAFLTIRTRTSNIVLNREKTEEYILKVRALITYSHGKNVSSYETDTTIHVRVLDRNDLSPLFYPTDYAVTIPEDYPKHLNILKVSADDADIGMNGEIYYSFLSDNEYFAIHPTTGEISVIKHLQYSDNAKFEITVLANDRGSVMSQSNQQASRAKVSINVTQVNFYAPEVYAKTFSSLTPISIPLIYGIVKVTDKDQGVNGEIKKLEIAQGNEDSIFYLEAADTIDEYYIKINKFAQLTQKQHVYNLTILAEDGGMPSRFTYKTVPIEIVQESTNWPIFTQQIYEVSIPETSPPNMPVIRLKVSDPDLGKNALVYLEIVGGNEGGEFRINGDSGMLYTQKPLDAERKSSYILTISAIDQANVGTRKQSSAKVKIYIEDMNDNDPVFEKFNKIIFINENELTGSFVTKLTAKDRDSGENAYISYSIANLNEVPFEIDHFSGVIKTTTLIDYETMRRNYTLIVRASDWGLPYRRQTEVNLVIIIKDINDNRPQFERINCYGKVLKSATIGWKIFTVSAIDFDAGDTISYRIVSGNDDDCFTLDSTMGTLSISCDLMKVELDERLIKIAATDGTHFSDELMVNLHLWQKNVSSNADLLTGQGSVECRETGVARRLAEYLALAEKNNVRNNQFLEIDDLALTPIRYGQNLHKPDFINFPVEIALNESVQLGESVALIQARDRDLGYNGKLMYAISSGDNESVFRIDPDSGELQVIGYLDRERQDQYLLNITVYDLGQPSKSDSKVVTITIMDANDNPPLLQKSLTTLKVAENVLNGTILYCLNATDADVGSNADIIYNFLFEYNDFGINQTSGCIYISGSLDREKKDKYELQVIVKDNGSPVLSAEAMIYVLVDDVNDNAPVFSIQHYVFKVREDLPRGTIVAFIEATDSDIGPNADILFSLKEDSKESDLFKIDKYSGAIKTKGYLNYENRQIHNLNVIATDLGVPPLTSIMPMVVEVIDVNENKFAPEFDDFVFSAKVRENQPRGTHVVNITARDIDEVDRDAKISYSIISGDGLGIFSVDDQGTIKTLCQLDAETKNFFWLTLCAHDNAIVPLSNCVKVFIEVENENDNIPLTDKPVYYINVMEGTLNNVHILQLNAYDKDIDSTQLLSYSIVSGNPEGYFQINSTTGILQTTERKLDRENQAEHILEVAISDNGSPSMSSTTRIVVSVLDTNDHSPEFDQRFYKIQVPSSASINESIFQVHASDYDDGENGRITYSIKSGKGKHKFRIDSSSGHLFLIKTLEPDAEFEINIKAEDNGLPKRSQIVRINVVVIPILPNSPFAPVILKKSLNNIVDVTENDRPGFLVALIQAVDEDTDQLWYNISGGDTKNEFRIGRDNGNVLLSKYLDYESKSFYNLTISVTDGTHVVHTNLIIQVVDINDNAPQFTKDVYHVNISENIDEESIIMQLHATDQDEDKKLFYHLHAAQDPSSLALFRIDSISGNVIVIERLDFEKTSQHILIAFVKDQGTPAKRDYAKIIINVHDHNDHYPEFTTKIIQSKVPESATIGSKVVQVVALDRDSGHNGELQYSIISGNIGAAFEIDSTFGIIFLAASLDINQIKEYMLQVKAIDLGHPPLSSQIPVHITVTMSENDPPKFFANTLSLEIFENLPIGTFLIQVEASSSSSVFFTIMDGNFNDSFRINPSTGVIVINGNIDYEINKLFNLTIKGTNMAAASSYQNIIVHILDVNDNSPYFLQHTFVGVISEASDIGSFVQVYKEIKRSHLTLNVTDADIGINGMLQYYINDDLARSTFKIDFTTGTVQTLKMLDYEEVRNYSFYVTVSDLGKPKLYSTSKAFVTIYVENVNDCPPKFKDRQMSFILYVPTFANVFVANLTAFDPDKIEGSIIRYDIVDGNHHESFQINPFTGILTTRNAEIKNSQYNLQIRASDGLFSTILSALIEIKSTEDKKFLFQRETYYFSTTENTTKVVIVGLINVLGTTLNENIEFKILNPTDLFVIGLSSGVIRTTGLVFDRELQEIYKLFIEAKSTIYDGSTHRVRRAITTVHVSVLDINDNCPLFVNLPYIATVSVDDAKGTVIMQVKAIDLDSAENGEVKYELKKGIGEIFKIDQRTGELSLKQNVESHNRNYDLTVAAYDGAVIPCSTEAKIQVKVIDRSMPVFEKQFYSVSIKEDVEMYAGLFVTIQATSPLRRKLIYTISNGHAQIFFEIDYRTGSLYVVNELNYEEKQSHEILIRATDSISGIYAQVPLSITVIDVNDCYPEIESDNYNVTLAENTPIGSLFLKINASDMDSGANAKLSYFIESVNKQTGKDLFHIDIDEGTLYVKTPLDYELTQFYHIIVLVKDHGSPPLTSKTNVYITVKDLNDNSPRFIEPSFFSKLSVAATRGQFVALTKAYDQDVTDNDNLEYQIVDGNDLQTYSIDKKNGVIFLQNMLNFTDKPNVFLNVSVSDRIHTSYARLKITLLPENFNSPQFEQNVYKASVMENQLSGYEIVTVKAKDGDFGQYANLYYEIVSEDMKIYFEIDRNTGSIRSRTSFDREQKAEYEVLLKATDGGAKFGYAVLRVTINDENDNVPYFLVKEYKTVTNALKQTNESILTVNAFDEDVFENGAVKYMIEPGSISLGLKNIIDIHEKTGEIFLKTVPDISEKKVFQFFVRAFDSGIPSLHNDIPVTIELIDVEVAIPIFEKPLVNLQIIESTPPGTVLTKLQLPGNYTAKYSIGLETNNFFVSENGEILLMQTIDREQKDSHYFVVMAETTTLPTLVAYAHIFIYVNDENDNHPKFDNAIYSAELAENFEKGASIIKITANDADTGSNGDIRYYLEDALSISNIFDIDIYTGWITLLSSLDREVQSEFNLKVMATDNGIPKHISKVPLSIKVVDYNDNGSQFKSEAYKISVFENALPGTVLKNFILVDSDIEKQDMDFYIISGDIQSQFQISKTGDLYIARPLDREQIAFYNLSLIATDGKFTTKAIVEIFIKDVNDNVPYCLKPRYNIQINESIAIGMILIKVEAVDFDSNEHFKLRYYISGKGSEDFVIEKDSGILKVAREVDRERYSKYKLFAHVQDGQELNRECVSELFITVNDINDNIPIFSMSEYIVSLPEDAQLQTVITKVHATDKDFGENRKIAYSLVGKSLEYFTISKSTGIIRLEKNLDREDISLFNITIKAEDYGLPKLHSFATLLIKVLDINDNPPEFSMKQYECQIRENETIGYEISRIHATSKDIGVNAEISYHIIGGNEQRKFSINTHTGVLSINGTLDYEKSKSYFLTLQAIDGGTPPLSKIAYVNISIMDINDNSPRFIQNIYRVSLREDILIGDMITDVKAIDEDSGFNGIVRYHISKGDILNQFFIHGNNGTICLARSIDRETISKYLLEVRACDLGTPELCDSVHISIDVLDTNDNAPVFSSTNYSVILQENKELGYVFITFEVSDADEPPNAMPYTFDIRSGNEGGYFRLEQDGSLSTASRLNHKLRNEFFIQVRVFDNGTPPLYSDAWVTINIIEESQYPPNATPLEVTINSFEDGFPGAYIGKMHANDQDKYDQLTYSLISTNKETYQGMKLFNITHKSGKLYAITNLDIGLYMLNVSVSDGKYTVFTTVKINVELITIDMMKHATILRFNKILASDFLLSHRKGFMRAIRNIMGCRQKDVILIALQPQTSETHSKEHGIIKDINLNVVFAVKKQQITPTSDAFFTSDEVRELLTRNINDIEDETNLITEEVLSTVCQPQENFCINGSCKKVLNFSKSSITTVTTDVISFVSSTYSQISRCFCKAGYDGKTCNETINACSSEPCSPQKSCLPSESSAGYQCVCPSGYSGSFCEINSPNCQNESCDSSLATSVSFGGKSYAHYKINKAMAKSTLETQFIYSLQIRTVQQTGTLLYASGKIDYNILEIVNGAVEYRFDLGSGEGLVSVSSIYVADGEWHTITVERILNTVKIIVDNKHFSQGSAPGVNEILNIQSNDLFIGAEVRPHPSIIGYENIQRGFIGCMSNINMAMKPLPLYISGGSTIAALKRFTNVEFRCDPANVLVKLGVCGAQPCLNNGICTEFGKDVFKCICHARFSGELCEIDTDPCSSSPCLYGGRCEYHGPNNFTCMCPTKLSGKRCEYGKFCNPNPCKNGGICEEGDGVSHCMCRGYTGPNCEIDINECKNQPCGNGATCINEAGSFRCICPSYLTGASCGDPLYSNSISTKLKNFSLEHISGIISGITIILIIIVIVLCCVVLKKNSTTSKKKIRKEKNKHLYKEENLNSLLETDKYSKANIKISNLEVNQRPISYASAANDGLFPNNSFVNNLDILRSYGSAGDELENIPYEYKKSHRTNQHINLNTSNVVDGDSRAYKQEWAEQMHLKTFSENKLNIERKKDCGIPVNRSSNGKLIEVAMPNVCHSFPTSSLSEYCVIGNGQYHWDCSDWVRKSHNPLPDITEVPGAEIADSSSFHSNDSNESKYKGACFIRREANPIRDIAPQNEDVSTDYVDPKIESHIQPFMLPNTNNEELSRKSSFYDSENEDYQLNTGKIYLRHPHLYLLPVHALSETEREDSANELSQIKADLLNTRTLSGNSEELYLFPSAIGENGSISNISVRVCEIEDSELEDFIPSQK